MFATQGKRLRGGSGGSSGGSGGRNHHRPAVWTPGHVDELHEGVTRASVVSMQNHGRHGAPCVRGAFQKPLAPATSPAVATTEKQRATTLEHGHAVAVNVRSLNAVRGATNVNAVVGHGALAAVVHEANR
jgi:hypothetical protein